MTDYLKKVRRDLKDAGRSKGEASDFIQQIQEIRREMNTAKVSALREAEKPFLDRLREAEEEYAIFLQLSS